MPVHVVCQQCQSQYAIDDKFAGKRAKCKRCGNVMEIPLPGPTGGSASPLDDTDGGGTEAVEPAPWAAPGKPRPANDWRRDDEVVIEREEDVTDVALAPSYAHAGPMRSPVGPLGPLLIIVFVAAVLFLAIWQQVGLEEQSVASSLPIWTRAVLQILTFFVLVGPLATVGFVVASKIRGFRLASPTYARALAVAALPLAVALVLGTFAGEALDALVFLAVVAVVGAITFQLVRTLFYLEPLSGLVSTGCSLVTGLIGFGLSVWLTQAFVSLVPAPPERPTQVAARPARPAQPQDADVPADDGQVSDDDSAAAPPQTQDADGAGPLREASQAKLWQIAAAIQRYFARSQGAWPRTLDELVSGADLPADELISPFAPEEARRPYNYLPSPTRYAGAADLVVAYDGAESQRPEGAGASVLFGDLSVRWLDKAELDRAIQHSLELRAKARSEGGSVTAAPATKSGVKSKSPEAAPGTMNPRPAPQPGPQSVEPDDGIEAPGEPAAAADFATRVRRSAGPLARRATGVPLAPGVEAVVATVTPSATFAVVQRGTGNEEVVEVWGGNPPARKGRAVFRVEPQFRGNYAVAPDGARLARIATFPKLSARVWSLAASRDVTTMDLDPAFGEPHLLGFTGGDRLLVRWENGMEHGLELWDAKAGKSLRRIPLPDHEAIPANEAVSPDGQLFAHAVRFKGRNHLALHQLARGGQPRRLPITALGEQWSIRPAGIAFSPDSSRVAALFVHEGQGLVVAWNVRTGKSVAEVVVPTAVQPLVSLGGRPARSLDWLGAGPGTAWLVCGTTVLNAASGEVLADLGATDLVGQSAGPGNVIRLASAKRGKPGSIAVVELDPARLPAAPAEPRGARPRAPK